MVPLFCVSRDLNLLDDNDDYTDANCAADEPTADATDPGQYHEARCLARVLDHAHSALAAA